MESDRDGGSFRALQSALLGEWEIPSDEAVTHILLDEGHLWGHKEVAIPIAAVGEIGEEEVTVRLTKHEIKELF